MGIILLDAHDERRPSMAHRQRTVTVLFLAVTLAVGLLATAPAGASNGGLSIRDARKAALVKVQKLQRKLRETGATGSNVPGCWRETRRSVGCLGMVLGSDELVRWRCAVPMTVRRPRAATASSRRVAVTFTDTMCSF
jgi:hypothetical protein